MRCVRNVGVWGVWVGWGRCMGSVGRVGKVYGELSGCREYEKV